MHKYFEVIDAAGVRHTFDADLYELKPVCEDLAFVIEIRKKGDKKKEVYYTFSEPAGYGVSGLEVPVLSSVVNPRPHFQLVDIET